MASYSVASSQSVDNALINEYNEETRALIDNLQDLQHLYSHQQQMLGQQGIVLDQAENNVQDASDMVDEGVENMIMQACINRKMCLYCGLCLFIVVVATVLGLVIGGCLSPTGPFHDAGYCLSMRGVNNTKTLPTQPHPKAVSV